MRLSDKTERWSMGNKRYEGKYKKHECSIAYSSAHYSKDPYWYFCYNGAEDKSYNSLWDGMKYDTKEECHDACIKHIEGIKL